MDYAELVKDIRYCVSGDKPCGECKHIEELCCDTTLLEKAADAIEELQNKLCDWCGVCPKERRRPSDCEIIYPNMQVPEVAIIPAEEGE